MNKITLYIIIIIGIILIMNVFNSNIYYITENYNQNIVSNKIKYEIPKNIYIYWDNLKNNDIIQYFIDNIKRKASLNNWKVFFITRENVHQYVDQKFYKKFINLNSVRFSDFLRLKLLYDNGGAWIDASTIIIQPTFLDNFRNKMIQNKCDVLLFEFKEKTLNKNYPFLENWFIMAPKHSIFIKDLYDYFEKSYDMGFYNFKQKILMPSKVDLNATIGYGIKTYHMQHALMHYMLLNNRNKYNICIENAGESMFKAQNNVDWKSDKLISFIINNNKWNDFYAIKLVGFNRKAINNTNKENFINKLKTI